MTALEILKGARALIATPEHWLQGLYQEGNSYCSKGALDTAYEDNNYYNARAALADAIGGETITEFNDHNDHATVLAAWDRAIATLEAKQ